MKTRLQEAEYKSRETSYNVLVLIRMKDYTALDSSNGSGEKRPVSEYMSKVQTTEFLVS